MTDAITPAELTAARSDLATMLPDTCSIQRATDTSDGGGGSTTTWPDIATDVPCRLTPATTGGAGTTRAGDRLNPTTTHIITIAAGTDARQGDRIVIGAQTFETLVLGDGGSWELARHLEARQIA